MDSDDSCSMALGFAVMLGILILVAYFVFAALDSLFDLHVLVIVALMVVLSLAITAGIVWLLTTNDSPLGCACSFVMLAVFLPGVVIATAIVSSVFV